MACVAPVYRPRDAEHTVLQQVIAEHLEAFLACGGGGRRRRGPAAVRRARVPGLPALRCSALSSCSHARNAAPRPRRSEAVQLGGWMTPGRLRARAAAGAVVILLAGCASARPPPVTNIGPLVGPWSGTVETDRGYQQFFYLTIYANLRARCDVGVYGSWDRVIVSNEQATYQMTPPPLEGALRFY